jgi:hypothetical protein
VTNEERANLRARLAEIFAARGDEWYVKAPSEAERSLRLDEMVKVVEARYDRWPE